MTTTEHDPQDGFCPKCDDYRPGTVTEHQGPDGETLAVRWECMACGYADAEDRIPGDADQCDDWREAGRLAEGQL